MLPLDNEHLDMLDDDMLLGDQFKSRYVDQIAAARDSIFNKMQKTANTIDYQDMRAVKLNNPNITKATLCDWLETVCCILDTYAVPMLQNAHPLPDNISKLRDEKISDQAVIIDLQGKLIEKKDDEIKSVKSTVKCEMKSYSSAVRKTCAEALAPKKIKTAIRKAADEKDRAKNLIIHGMKEEEEEVLECEVNKILEHLNEKPRISSCCRVGITTTDRVRPVRFTLSSSDLVQQILKKSKLLKDVVGLNTTYICPDRSFEDRLIHKKLVEELKQKRTKEPNKVHHIRNNKIVSTDKDS